jgi:GNAT superfamily N-acetyltransferase
MKGLLIRRAIPSEQTKLEALQLRASLGNARDRDHLLAHPDAIELPIEQISAGGVFVAEWIGVMAGFSAVLPRLDGNAELDALFVDPDLRRLGIGRSLLDHSAQVARAQGCSALHVVGNPHAEVFYLACGFQLIGTTETRFGPGLLLRKEL